MILLAQYRPISPESRLEGIHNEFVRRSQASEAWTTLAVALLIVAAVILVAWAAWQLYMRHTERQQRNAHKLFRDALGYLGLAPADRRLLQRVVRELRLAEPTRMLLSPEAFDEVAERWLTRRVAASQAPATKARLAAIRRFLLPDPPRRPDDASPASG